MIFSTSAHITKIRGFFQQAAVRGCRQILKTLSGIISYAIDVIADHPQSDANLLSNVH